MRPVRWLIFYLAVIFIGGPLLAPWLYLGVQSLAEHLPSLQKLAASPFHRFVNRSLLVLAVVGLWPLFRGLQIRRWEEIGLQQPLQNLKRWGLGFAIGLISLAVAALIFGLGGARGWNLTHTGPQVVSYLLGATLASLFVALLEEIVFRGVVFGTLRQALPWPGALFLSSAIYAIVHFFAKPEPPATINWLTGFTVLGGMLHGFTNLQELIPTFFNLLIVGCILALAYQKTGTLYLSMGMHAGWIFWLKSVNFITTPTLMGGIWGMGKLIDSWIATLVLAPVLIGLLCLRTQAGKASGDPA